MEHLLHYVWKHKLFPLCELRTTDGMVVEVIDPGLYNSDAGPDFFNAKLKIDGVLWVGNVEMHILSSDWYRHGHDKDKLYDTVILNVVDKADTEIKRSDGQKIPQMELVCPEYVKANYQLLCDADSFPPCYSILPSLSRLTIDSWLTALQTERLQQKAESIFSRLHSCNFFWEDALFITMARNYGFGVNGDIFERWAKHLPFRAVDKHRDDLFQIEAFFFGQAGFLENTFLSDKYRDEYWHRLQNEFQYLQHKFSLSSVMDSSLWRFLRLRPQNFPYVRMAQLAYIFQKRESLFSLLMEADTIESLRVLLQTNTSDYWKSHFVFGKPSVYKEKKLGDKSLDLVIINTVIPFLYAYGMHKGDMQISNKASEFLESMKAEDNHILHLWNRVGLKVDNAADSQALVHLQTEYCNKKKCLFCRFGYEYLKHQ